MNMLFYPRKAEEPPLQKGSEGMEQGMTNAEFNAFLETLAKLVESKAETVAEAAEIIRQAKA